MVFMMAEERKVGLFNQEASEADWKKDHDEAMQCIAFEKMLRFGVVIYEGLILFDEKVRASFAKNPETFDPKYDAAITKVFEWWLRPCDQLETDLDRFLEQGFAIEDATRFRKYHAEAKWIVKAADEMLKHPKMAALRDKAVEDLRAGRAEDW